MNASNRSATLVVLLALICLAPVLLLRAEVPSANSFLEPDFAITTNKVVPYYDPRLASNGTNFLVAWVPEDRGRVEYARVSGAGEVEQGVFDVTTRTRNYVSVASDGKDYLLVWIDVVGTNLTKAAKISGSGPLTNRVVNLGPCELPAVASDGTNWLITSRELDWIGFNGVILDSNLVAGPVFQISNSRDEFSAVAFNGSNYLCAWQREPDIGVFACRISPTGEVLDTNHIVITPENLYRHPIRTASDGTNFMVAWGQDLVGGGREIRAARITASGELLDANGVIVIPGPDRWTMDLCYSGRDYVINGPTFDFSTYTQIGTGIIFKEPGRELAQFVHSGFYSQGIASDGGRILIAATTETGIRGRFLDTRPRLQPFTLGSPTTTLSWSTVKERTYQVEQNATLELNAWTAVSGLVTATNSILTISVPTNAQPHSFYRIRQLP